MVNSKQKGSRGERDARDMLKRLGFEARRGQQYSGTETSADLITSVEGVHFEVKRTETLSLYKALEQAHADCGDNTPVVLHRKNKKKWVFIIEEDDIDDFVRKYTESKPVN